MDVKINLAIFPVRRLLVKNHLADRHLVDRVQKIIVDQIEEHILNTSLGKQQSQGTTDV